MLYRLYIYVIETPKLNLYIFFRFENKIYIFPIVPTFMQ